jgi:ribosomal protein L40E
MQSIRQFIARFRSWVAERRAIRHAVRRVSMPRLIEFPSYVAPIHREVTATGVLVFSLCGGCGARLNASATLCDECAAKRSRPARPI